MRRTSNLLAYVLAALALLSCAWFLAARMRPSANPAPVAPAPPAATTATEGPGGAARLAAPAQSSTVPSVEPSSGAERRAPELSGVALSGRLVGLERPQRYDELRVVLWAKGTTPDCTDLATATAHAGTVRVVRASEDGTFVFDGLDPKSRYELCAGGARHVSLPMAGTIAPAEGPLTLELVRVKGLRIELVDAGGDAPRALPLLVSRGLVLSGSALTQAGTELAAWERELAGVPGTGCGAEPPPFGRLLVLRGPPQFTRIGPITSYVEIPGYAVESPTFWAPMVMDLVPTERIFLRQVTSGWGTLELELVGLGDALRSQVSDDSDLGELSIVYDDGSKLSLAVIGGAALRRFEGLPHGELRWSYRSSHAFAWPRDGGALPLRIGRELSRATVDLSQAGALHVRFDGPATPEPLPFEHTTIANVKGRNLLSVKASRMPWTALVIEPGEYRQVHVMGRDELKNIGFMVPVRDGRSSTVEPGSIATLTVSAAALQFPAPAR